MLSISDGDAEKEVGLTESSGPVLRAGEKLVHIGPLETGTTTVQGAFHTARDRLSTHGVLYAGRPGQTLRAVSAALGKPTPPGLDPFRIEEWQALASEVAAAEDRRVVVSSESFADAGADVVPALVAALGGPAVRVVVTVRPLASIMPSYWQYVVQNGVRTPYETWLRKTLARAEEEPASTFWRRQRHDRLVQRWAEVVGEENVNVVVVDDTDRGMVLRSFETLAGLPDGFLTPAPSGDDRALTFGEIELVRNLNNEFENLGLTGTTDGRFLRRGVVRQMKALRPGHDDQKVVTPDWALERCAEIGAEMASNIACSDVRLIGNIAGLGRLDPGPETEPEAMISVELASAAVLGSVRAAKQDLCGLGDRAAASVAPALRDVPLEHGRVADVRARDLLVVLAERVRRRMLRTLRLGS